NWDELSELLNKKLGKAQEVVAGKPSYDYLSMYKILLLQQWHNLSDPKMEESLKTRIDFMWFTGFGLASVDFAVPDETTICRFRGKLVKHNILDKLLKLVNRQLERHNLKVKITNGAILDATLIEAAVNSKAKPNVIVEDRKEEDNNSGGADVNKPVEDQLPKVLKANQQTEIEIDKDAKWLKKRNKNVFGYKNFVTTDTTDGYIESVEVTPANVSEIRHLDAALSTIDNHADIKVLFTDKGYYSQANIDLLKSKGIGNGIMKKATRGKALDKKQLHRNKRISKTRYIVERTNATTSCRFHFKKAKYIGLARVTAQALLVATAHNLLKAANKINLLTDIPRIIVSIPCEIGLFA
ncbi:MAG: IS5 family transposase, partial [Neisseriaceae bacterium]